MNEVSDPSEVQYYDAVLQSLAHSQSEKAAKFIEFGCIKKIDKDHYDCDPIPGYNHTTYSLSRSDLTGHGWCCNCQGFNASARKSPQSAYCSHIGALMLFFKSLPREGSAKTLGEFA